jgi:hypothetical protein
MFFPLPPSPLAFVFHYLDECQSDGLRYRMFSVVLIYISFVAKEFDHCFVYLLAICSENCLFRLFARLLIELFILLLFIVLQLFMC